MSLSSGNLDGIVAFRHWLSRSLPKSSLAPPPSYSTNEGRQETGRETRGERRVSRGLCSGRHGKEFETAEWKSFDENNLIATRLTVRSFSKLKCALIFCRAIPYFCIVTTCRGMCRKGHWTRFWELLILSYYFFFVSLLLTRIVNCRKALPCTEIKHATTLSWIPSSLIL